MIRALLIVLFFFILSSIKVSAYTYCPLFSSYDFYTDSCECNYGYVYSGGRCISDDQYCQDIYGYNAQADYSGGCECRYGYVIYGGECISEDQYCKNLYGYNAQSDYFNGCKCRSGYVLSGSQCVNGNTYCSNNYGLYSSYDSLSNECECNFNYVWNTAGNKCISKDDLCEEQSGYGAQSDGFSSCECMDEYIWDESGTACIEADSFCQENMGFNSHYDGYSESCACDEDYVFDEYECVDEQDFCNDQLGDYSYYVGDGECECEDGYEFEDGECIEENNFIINSFRSSSENSDNSNFLLWLIGIPFLFFIGSKIFDYYKKLKTKKPILKDKKVKTKKK